MHPTLKAVYESTVEQFLNDPRIVAAWEFGSIGKGTADELSDVDPIFVVDDDFFDEVDRELRPLMERFGYRIALWWPEAFNAPGLKNYAILFEVDELLQYDMMIVSVSAVQTGFAYRILTSGTGQILFDKTGLLQSLLDAHDPTPYTPEKLIRQIERYWVYVYIHVKYLRRSDQFKLLYGQQTLFQNHLDILRSLHPDADWSWWPWSVKNVLSPSKQDELLVYFGAAGSRSIAAALQREMDIFAADAREACQVWGQVYPDALEADIRAHVNRHI